MPQAVASHDGPVAKRQRLDAHAAQPDRPRATRSSRLFAPFRTVGLVSPTDVPFTTVPLGKTSFQITTSAGRCLQTYDLRRGLNLVFITRPQTPEVISATSAWKDKTLAAWGGATPEAARGVWVFKRGKKVDELETPPALQENISQLLVFGAWIVGCCATRIEVWKSATLEHYTTLTAPRIGSAGSLLTGGICNMPTYLNKIFAGRQDGSVEIWNLSTGKLLYTVFPPAAEYGSVTALQPTTALSLLAIAYSSGPVVIHNIRTDKEVMVVNTGSARKTPVTSISFRTDGLGAGDDGRKDGVMATACKDSGDVTFWDLNGGGRKMGVLRGAHNPPSAESGGVAGGISKVEFLAGQAVLLTSGLDNSLKTWIFDETPFSPVPRILHSRSGHAAPVTSLQFLPSDADGADAGGKWLLSASRDRTLWGWSLRRDGQSTELSQGNIRKKAKKMGILSDGLASIDSSIKLEDLRAPKITCMSCSLNRDGGMGAVPGNSAIWNNPNKVKGASNTEASGSTGWESIITGHEDSKTARTWFWGKKKAGRWAFDTGDSTPVTSVAISPCGTFALVGSMRGGIDMFNLQSGIHRQRFPARLTSNQAKKLKLQQIEDAESEGLGMQPKKFARGQGKHMKAVTGLVVDNLNRTVISSGEDGKLKFWDFSSGLLLHEIDWYPMVTISSARYHRGSDLLALSCSDSSIRVVDTETKKLVRELFGCNGRITDFTFSNDGRWVIAASTDSIIRIWDLPTGHMIDAMKLRSTCTSLAFSNTGEYLAVAQEDDVGVHIWTNRTLFTHVPTRHISDAEIAEIDAPTVSGEGGEGIVSAAYAEDNEELGSINDDTSAPSIDQLNESITTLSLVPKSRWQNLLHLDLIRERNKPKEPPKAPEKAPFFLPSLQNGVASTAPTLNGDTSEVAKAQEVPGSRISKASTYQTEFSRHLAHAAKTVDFAPLLAHLSSLSPSAADLAIRSLDPPPSRDFVIFIDALTVRLRERRDYELVQAWMSVFLRLHGDVANGNEDVRESLEAWREEAASAQQRLGSLGAYCVGVVGFLRSAR
ncbi:Utp21-domain-containing protein [Saccharata proteae CBS 121410]|uniref:Utp21-domain-containing protein n=1 Tax=Saccharata proteae CBS 121410 TaxID=1314787 RepID=A0A9P4HNN6_9PEZI|nr:Utp21-domain-containing protein [Saccharata proteae CBS 121410]